MDRQTNEKDRIRLLTTQNEQLKAQLMSLSLISELTKVLNSCTDQVDIFKTVLLGIQDILNFDRVIFFNIDEKKFVLRPYLSVGVGDETNLMELNISLGFEGGDITDAIFLNRHFIVSEPEPREDIFFKRLNSRCYLVIPFPKKLTRKCWEVRKCNKITCPAYGTYNPYCWSILGAQQLLSAKTEDERRRSCLSCTCFGVEGVLWMDRYNSNQPITGDDITVLATILMQAAVIIENQRIFNALEHAHNELKKTNLELSIAQARINSDLEHARSIQQGLLPQGSLNSDKFTVASLYIPADKVGGDYYDVFTITDSIFGVIIADVSGHGVASALIMAMVKVLLKSYAGEEISPQKTLERINRIFISDIKTDNFVTIFYAVLDAKQNKLLYTSAGHCPALFLKKSDRSCEQRQADGLFLGAFEQMMLQEQVFVYQPGEIRIVLYTDGLIEAQNGAGEMYDVERLQNMALQTLELPPQQAINKIFEHHKDFCGPSHVPEDDITLLVIDL